MSDNYHQVTKQSLPFLLLTLLLTACMTPLGQISSPKAHQAPMGTLLATADTPTATADTPTATADSATPGPPYSATDGIEPTLTAESLPGAYPAPAMSALIASPYPGAGTTGESLPAVVETSPPEGYPAPSPAVTMVVDGAEATLAESAETVWTYRIVGEFPHDPLAYTQGLVVEKGVETLLESTGRASTLRRVDLQTGEVQQQVDLPAPYFGEGMTLFDNRIIQLTWREQVGFVYDATTFQQIGEFHYPHEGWGLTHDGVELIVSDGTDVIRFWDPATFEETRRIQVKSLAGPVTDLNELEYVEGEIWANVWYSDRIARISPLDGCVLGWIDLTGIINPELRADFQSVLNGIAFDELSGRLFVTGKNWPSLFEIEVVKPDNPTPGQ